jgi:hypothetical protein
MRRILKMEEMLLTIEKTTDTFRRSLSETWDAINDIRPVVEKTGTEVSEMRVALLGDLHEHKGILTRVREMERVHETMWRKLDELGIAVVGDKETAGHSERLRTLEVARQKSERMFWLIFAVVMGQFAIILKDLIVGALR